MVCLAATSLAGPLNKQQIASGAKWLLHGDMEGLMASKVGQKIQQEAQKPGAAQILEGIKTIYGINPLTDIKSVTLYGMKVGSDDGVALIRANVDREKLVNLLKLNPDYKGTRPTPR